MNIIIYHLSFIIYHRSNLTSACKTFISRQEGETEHFTTKKNRLPLFGQPLIARPAKFLRYIIKNEVTLWSAIYSTCVVYTKTMIHLSVSE